MAVTDSLADMLTIIRNGSRTYKDAVNVKNSKFGRQVLEIFKAEGYIRNFKVIDDKNKRFVKVYLKYKDKGKISCITDIKRVSKPGLRRYVTRDKIPRPLRGLGTAVLSTSKGLVTDDGARKVKVGGEVICYIW